ncbi:hypothetical protein BB559_000957, partial [Furculomyces boomerangus]
IWSVEKIKKEAIYNSTLWGAFGFMFANVFGRKVLNFSPKTNLASSIVTMLVSGVFYHGIYKKDLMKMRKKLLLETSNEDPNL